MKEQEIELIVEDKGALVFFTILYLQTGEIRQKRRSKEWVLKRVFHSELRTWEKNDEEYLVLKKNL